MNLFEYAYDRFYFDNKKPIKLFEAFAGVGTQAMALKKLVEVEHVGISEIDKFAIESYNAIHGEVKNYGDITKIAGGGLPKIDIFTYSFPCQDLSKAGKQEGMEKGTRSGLVWEVVRILQEMPIKPKVLLMENVIDLVSAKFVDGFNELQYILSEMGYTNWNEILNARDFGVAQNRQRVFMVSILGEYVYTFPRPFKLEKKLKDYLENNVDEKYFLSDNLIKTFITSPKTSDYPRKEQWEQSLTTTNIKGIATTITTRAGQRPLDNYIISGKTLKEKLANELIKNKIVKGGEVVSHSYTNDRNKKGLGAAVKSRDGIVPTLTTRPDTLGVVINEYSEKSMEKITNNIVDENGLAKTLTAQYQRPTIDSATLGKSGLRIRKLTPLETWRLMGIDDNDFKKAQATGLSDTQLYKQAGNAIVVDVLYYIFKNMIKGK